MFIGGQQGAVEKAFRDLEYVRRDYEEDVDNVVEEAYRKLHEIADHEDRNVIVVTTWNVLSELFYGLGIIASGVKRSVVDDHPRLRAAMGRPYQQLRQLNGRLHQEAQEKVTKAVEMVERLVGKEVSVERLEEMMEIRKYVVQATLQSIRPLREQAWKRQFEHLAPLIQDDGAVKRILERHMATSLCSDLTATYQETKAALLSGNPDQLHMYARTLELHPDSPAVIWAGRRAVSRPAPSFALRKWMAESRSLDGKEVIPALQKLRQRASQASHTMVLEYEEGPEGCHGICSGCHREALGGELCVILADAQTTQL